MRSGPGRWQYKLIYGQFSQQFVLFHLNPTIPIDVILIKTKPSIISVVRYNSADIEEKAEVNGSIFVIQSG